MLERCVPILNYIMKLLLILLLISKTGISVAQKSSILEGKWKIIAMYQVVSSSQDSLYYDLEKDSIYIPTEDLKEANKDGLDSIRTVNLFKSMFESFKGSMFTFRKDSVVFEYKSTKAIGTYEIKSKDTLAMHLIYDDQEMEHIIFIFSFKGDLLNILRQEDIFYSRFILRKD